MSGRPAVYAHTAAGGDDELARQHSECALFLQHREFGALTRYEDQGNDRSARDRMMAAIEDGEHSVLVVWDLDRLSRNMRDLADLVERLDAAGCRLATVTDGTLGGVKALIMAAVFRDRV